MAVDEVEGNTRSIDLQQPQNPTLQKSWNVILKEMEAHDDGLVKGYKEDIDTLLVFAGLFSAVVTGFTVESYKWLSEDSSDTTVALLRQISRQLNGQTLSQFEPLRFTPEASSIRINTFWFLSLILSLMDALFGLLCKQWLREHDRQASTRTASEALTLRWFRNTSFERWGVPQILATLPILLEIALFFFFVGLLDLLWSRHHIPFTVAMAVVGCAVLFYLITTIAPGVNVMRQALQLYPFAKGGWPPDLIFRLPPMQFVCPYKSPQSWFMLRLFSAISRFPGCKQLLRLLLTRRFELNPAFETGIIKVNMKENVYDLSDWRDLDVNIVRRFSNVNSCPDLYELQGFRWLVREFQDLPSMIPHLKNVLEQVPPYLVLPSVFDEWTALQKKMWNTNSLDSYIGANAPLLDLYSREIPAHIAQVLYFRHLAIRREPVGDAKLFIPDEYLLRIAKRIWNDLLDPKDRRTIGFLVPFVALEGILDSPFSSPAFQTLDFYMECWSEVTRDSRLMLVKDLSTHMAALTETEAAKSVLVISPQGLKFFAFVNHELIFDGTLGWGMDPEVYIYPWLDALDRIRVTHRLTSDYFDSLPGYFHISPHRLEAVLNDSSTSESLLEVLDHFERVWDDVWVGQTVRVVEMLSRHMNHFPLSHSGIRFLSFVNKRLADTKKYFFTPEREAIVHAWSSALERHVRVVKSLSLDHFEPISIVSNVRDVKVVAWYRAGEKIAASSGDHGEIFPSVEASKEVDDTKN